MEGPPVSWAWGEGDTWGHSRHLGVQSRRESGQSPLPHSQFPSPGQPAPVDGRAPPLLYPRPCTHRPGGPHPDHGHGLLCMQRSEKRQAEKGTQAPSPEAGAREEVCQVGWRPSPPHRSGPMQAPRWSPQTPVSADTTNAHLSPPRPDVQPSEWGGVSLRVQGMGQ